MKRIEVVEKQVERITEVMDKLTSSVYGGWVSLSLADQIYDQKKKIEAVEEKLMLGTIALDRLIGAILDHFNLQVSEVPAQAPAIKLVTRKTKKEK